MKFVIECEMNDRWVDHFCSMLKYMERCGQLGHSCIVAFYSDGDGDFRPEFDIKTDFNKVDGFKWDSRDLPKPEVVFDAG